ncbi:hypothetical protein [Actinomadura atramentaria]|uniref:hypothetical protein n=1 Tax=Actinomadura atramentaria TaxID=1990 RepID=UPI00035CC4A1|nr:hypothetical protein [Actinomadura atramentaria]
MDNDGVYEVRHGATRSNISMLIGCLIFTACAIALPDMAPITRVLGTILFGAGFIMALITITTRRVSLRVDAEGITIGGNPFRYQKTTLHAPWNEVAAIILWKQTTTAKAINYIGFEHKETSSATETGSARRFMSRAVVPHVPPHLVRSSRPINGWRLDRTRLTAAVTHFAPQVNVTNLG